MLQNVLVCLLYFHGQKAGGGKGEKSSLSTGEIATPRVMKSLSTEDRKEYDEEAKRKRKNTMLCMRICE